ncbi:MAG: hypothetical protein B7Y98_05145 [Sphingomonas sp. 32-62-10]|nr:MAG: hypothetical protein B7Z43_07245 [Sphingomonas sp. 12-62-6]OYX39320.1 MAG: hypothetical protein B7Y98_05145 [Sphingomonas sp. 32-62-10]
MPAISRQGQCAGLPCPTRFPAARTAGGRTGRYCAVRFTAHRQPHFGYAVSLMEVGRHQLPTACQPFARYPASGSDAMTYERLMQEHDRIDHHLDRMTYLIQQENEDAVGATLILSDLADELRLHLAHEDSLMYRPMVAAHRPAFIKTADDFCRQFETLRCDWDRYLVEWTTGIIRADWVGFRASTLIIIERLKARVRAENDLLYAAALQAGAITLRETVNA